MGLADGSLDGLVVEIEVGETVVRNVGSAVGFARI